MTELPTKPLITVEEAAAFLGLSRSTAYRHAAAQELPTVRIGGRVYVSTERLRELLGVR